MKNANEENANGQCPDAKIKKVTVSTYRFGCIKIINLLEEFFYFLSDPWGWLQLCYLGFKVRNLRRQNRILVAQHGILVAQHGILTAKALDLTRKCDNLSVLNSPRGHVGEDVSNGIDHKLISLSNVEDSHAN